MTNSTDVALEGAFQYDSCDPESKGASNENNGADPAAVST